MARSYSALCQLVSGSKEVIRIAPTDRPDVGYAMIFPSMTILKILFVQLAVVLMEGGKFAGYLLSLYSLRPHG
ncbi:MAG: hypothetical protein HY789_05020 [Deltaproteobacteria bacterium]|nr:hypothetical protein [Deltaproteobacteria bacterium]